MSQRPTVSRHGVYERVSWSPMDGIVSVQYPRPPRANLPPTDAKSYVPKGTGGAPTYSGVVASNASIVNSMDPAIPHRLQIAPPKLKEQEKANMPANRFIPDKSFRPDTASNPYPMPYHNPYRPYGYPPHGSFRPIPAFYGYQPPQHALAPPSQPPKREKKVLPFFDPQTGKEIDLKQAAPATTPTTSATLPPIVGNGSDADDPSTTTTTTTTSSAEASGTTEPPPTTPPEVSPEDSYNNRGTFTIKCNNDGKYSIRYNPDAVEDVDLEGEEKIVYKGRKSRNARRRRKRKEASLENAEPIKDDPFQG